MRFKSCRRFVSVLLAVAMITGLFAIPVKADGSITLSGICHVQDYGDTPGTWDASTGTLTLGTRGQSKRVEAITINISNNSAYAGSIQYRVHVQNDGWQGYKMAGSEAGTRGRSLRLEGIEMQLVGELAKHYTIEYAVHIQDYGDAQGFVSDGALAGTTGESKRLEEVKVRIVPRGTGTSTSVNYRVHRQDYGWESRWAKNGEESGTTGQSKRLEGIEIHLTGNQYTGSIEYHTHIQNIGWESVWAKDGEMSGTQGMSYRLEGIEIRLIGEVANHYDVYYRVHAQDYGWLGWAKNGQMSGTSGMSKRLEAIQIVLVAKNGAAPGNVCGVKSVMSQPAVINGTPTSPTGTQAAVTSGNSYAGKTYEIIPMLAPFNQYFYVKTDNMDGSSFRFKDVSSKYVTSSSSVSTIAIENVNYADVVYENSSAYRVKGGYIFYSGNTDGGEVVLQVRSGSSWTDTSVVITLPVLVSNCDYLVQTYTDPSKGYFENMDAVQEGFESICLYGGPSIRGEVKKIDGAYWGIYTSPHVDQSFYIGSPYTFSSSTPMLTTRLYPFRYDSLGFPSMMISVSNAMGYSGVTYAWSGSAHYFVNFTYNGKTKTYGGAGNGHGHAINSSDINGYFKFDNSSSDLYKGATLTGLYSRIWAYMQMPEPSAGYNTNEFTWNTVFNTIGSRSWIRVYAATSVFGGGHTAYTLIARSVRKPENQLFGYAPGSGGSLDLAYVTTDMRYYSNCWVDGRYINSQEFWEEGATFDEHNTASIVITNPVIKVPDNFFTAYSSFDTAKYDPATGQWSGDVKFNYNPSTGNWIAEMYSSRFSGNAEFVDACTLTQEEVAAMNIDGNTNTAPLPYYNFDRSEAPGKYYTS